MESAHGSLVLGNSAKNVLNESLFFTRRGSGGKNSNKESSEAKTGPYSHLEDPPNVGPGKDFTAAQKKKIIEENKKINNGVVKSDDPNDVAGSELVKPAKSQKGVTPPKMNGK